MRALYTTPRGNDELYIDYDDKWYQNMSTRDLSRENIIDKYDQNYHVLLVKFWVPIRPS